MRKEIEKLVNNTMLSRKRKDELTESLLFLYNEQQSELLNDFLVKLRGLLNFTHSQPLPKYVDFYLKDIL